MLSNIILSILSIGFLISMIYGMVTIIKNRKIKIIFTVTFIAMVAFFISRLFFLVLNISQGEVYDFSVGVLGQVAGYLFLVLANSTYMPVKNKSWGISIKALPILLIPIACYGYSFFCVGNFGNAFSLALYLCSTCLAMYFSFRNILSVKSNPDYKKLSPYFICVMVLTVASTLENVIFLIDNQTVSLIIEVILGVLVFATSILLLPALKRGVKNAD